MAQSDKSTSPVQWQAQQSNTTARLRGLSIVNQKVVWASGTNGTYLRTIDGGANWQAAVVPGAAALDFRDIQAFDEKTAYLLSIGAGDSSRIYKTTDGGKNWLLQFTNDNANAFFDAFAFWDKQNGIAFSDPIDNRIPILMTRDGGNNWQLLPKEQWPMAQAGESAFAASGSCIAVLGNNVWIATGGAIARVHHSRDRGRSWRVTSTPLISGRNSAGIFSIAFKDEKNGIIVGGDYQQPDELNNNAAITNDGGKTWMLLKNRPNGYRSCVVYLDSKRLVAVGQTGADSSANQGTQWQKLDLKGCHTVGFARNSSIGWAVGDDGRVYKFTGK